MHFSLPSSEYLLEQHWFAHSEFSEQNSHSRLAPAGRTTPGGSSSLSSLETEGFSVRSKGFLVSFALPVVDVDAPPPQVSICLGTPNL